METATKRAIGKNDCNGTPICEGDIVLMPWLWGKFGTGYRASVINAVPAHLMANGQMQDDGGGIIWRVGDAYNFWKGEEVRVLSENEAKELPLERLFFFDANNKPVVVTDQHFMGLSDEEWQAEKVRRATDWVERMYGKEKATEMIAAAGLPPFLLQ